MTIDQITAEMQGFNRHVACGSECAAWQDFHAECHDQFGVSPTSDDAFDVEASPEFANYWLFVAAGLNGDYDAETGDRIA